MARELNFKIKDKTYALSPSKIERKKLYGWTETVALDDDGEPCKLVTVDESGGTIIPQGGIVLGVLDNNFCLVDKTDLVAVDDSGNSVPILPSSFSETIELKDMATVEEFLDHVISSVYELTGIENCPEFLQEISDKIYTFTFNYREGYEGTPAFVFESGGKAFLLAGMKNNFPFVGLEELGYLEEAQDEDASEGSDDIDFGMM